MDSHFYSEFIEATRHHNLADAADRLSLSTSALSRHIQAAESELGVSLFDRTSRGIVLNRFGEIFLSYSQQIVRLQEDCASELRNLAHTTDSCLTISCDFQFSAMLTEFLKNNPMYKIKVLNTGTGLADLINNCCSCAITDEMCANDEPRRLSNIVSIPFSEAHFCIVVYSSHWLAREKHARLADLANEQFILVHNPISHEAAHQELFESAGFQPNISMTVQTYGAAIHFVSEEIGITIALSNNPHTEDTNVAFVDIEPKISRTFYLRYRKGVPLSSSAKSFIKFVQNKNLQ